MSYAGFARTTFINMLDALDHIVATAQEAGVADDVLGHRLVDDMFTLELQFRVAINQVLLALRQVADHPGPLDEETYASFAEVRERIAAARTRVEQCEESCWAAADAPVIIDLPNGVRFSMTCEDDIRDWIMPNFYFHLTMAYALLRKHGLNIGKMDFIPHMSRHIVPSSD